MGVSAGWGFAAFLLSAAWGLLCAEGLLLLPVLTCTGKAGQQRRTVTDSSHQAAGREGTFPAPAMPFCVHADSVTWAFVRSLLGKVVEDGRVPLRAICSACLLGAGHGGHGEG